MKLKYQLDERNLLKIFLLFFLKRKNPAKNFHIAHIGTAHFNMEDEMDINAEKEKATFIYKLEVRKMILDKILFGIILLILGMIANVLIEHYRSNLTEERFLLEKRLEAINNIRAAHAELFNIFDLITVNVGSDKPVSDSNIKEYMKALDNFILVESKWSTLLPEEFDRQISFYVWNYTGAIDEFLKVWRVMSVQNRVDNRLFLDDARKAFDDMCRQMLGIDKNKKKREEFEFERWSLSKASENGANAFYHTNFKKWHEAKHANEHR